MDLKTFLEEMAPYTLKEIDGFKRGEYDVGIGNFKQKGFLLNLPTLKLYCGSNQCDGFRLFKSSEEKLKISIYNNSGTFELKYHCKNCSDSFKHYAIRYQFKNESIYLEKFGEHPRFGTRVPKGVLDLFGANKDRENFLKGRQSEDQGYGIGAYSYYRRVVENKKDALLDKIIKVCKEIGVSEDEIERIENAKQKTQFSSAIDDIKDILPNSLYIKGHNPLTLLHTALSKGIHNLSDEECLEQAKNIRAILTNLVNRINTILEKNKEVEEAVNHLVGKDDSKDSDKT